MRKNLGDEPEKLVVRMYNWIGGLVAPSRCRTGDDPGKAVLKTGRRCIRHCSPTTTLHPSRARRQETPDKPEQSLDSRSNHETDIHHGRKQHTARTRRGPQSKA